MIISMKRPRTKVAGIILIASELERKRKLILDENKNGTWELKRWNTEQKIKML